LSNEELPWIYDSLYFGNAMYPSDELWRYRGTQYQVQIWSAFKTEQEALEWVELEKEFLDSFEHKVYYEEGSYGFPWRTTAWYQPEDGRAMQMYIKAKRAAWL